VCVGEVDRRYKSGSRLHTIPTTEFYIYYFIFVVICGMFLSKPGLLNS
jgi:hypothetical protein